MTVALATARATAEVLAFTGVALAVCFGLGKLALRAWRGAQPARIEPDTTAWVGWGTAVALIQLWHLALAPSWPLAAVLCAAGAAGLALARAEVRDLLAGAWRSHRGFLVAFALAALWLANTSLGPPRNGDSGLYHLQAVRWAAAYPDVPGLANLLGRLGFASSYTLYLALPEALAGTGRACHLANAVLLLLPVGRGVWALATLAPRGTRWRASALFDLLFLFPLAERVWSEQALTSASPDFPVFVLGAVVTSMLLRTVEARDDARLDLVRLGAATWLAAVGVTVKLSFGGFAAAAAALAALLAVRRRPDGAPIRARVRGGAAAALACAAVVAPWLARSVVLSGYPLYPLTAAGVAVEWRVPRAAALDDYNWIRSWARRPGADWHEVLGGWGWLAPWAHDLVATRYTLLTIVAPLALAALALAVGAALGRARPRGASLPLLAVVPAAASLAFWFVTAPGPRFAGSSFWILGLGAAAVAAGGREAPSPRARVWLAAAFAVAAAAALAKLHGRGLLPVTAGPDGGFHPAPPVALSEFRTTSGLVLHVPVGAENCWDAPLPCTPWPDRALRLRAPGDLRRGFTVAPPAGGARP